MKRNFFIKNYFVIHLFLSFLLSCNDGQPISIISHDDDWHNRNGFYPIDTLDGTFSIIKHGNQFFPQDVWGKIRLGIFNNPDLNFYANADSGVVYFSINDTTNHLRNDTLKFTYSPYENNGIFERYFDIPAYVKYNGLQKIESYSIWLYLNKK